MIYYRAVIKRGVLKNKFHRIQDAEQIWKRFPFLHFYYSENENLFLVGTLENLISAFPEEYIEIQKNAIGKDSGQDLIEEAQWEEELREYKEARKSIHSFIQRRVPLPSSSFVPSKYTGGVNDTNKTADLNTVKRIRPPGSPTYNKR